MISVFEADLDGSTCGGQQLLAYVEAYHYAVCFPLLSPFFFLPFLYLCKRVDLTYCRPILSIDVMMRRKNG